MFSASHEFSLLLSNCWILFFFNDTATTEIYTLSLHDALPISIHVDLEVFRRSLRRGREAQETGRSREAIQYLRAAVAVHRGEFLADLTAPWIDRQREETDRQLVAAAKELATLELEWKEPK